MSPHNKYVCVYIYIYIYICIHTYIYTHIYNNRQHNNTIHHNQQHLLSPHKPQYSRLSSRPLHVLVRHPACTHIPLYSLYALEALVHVIRLSCQHSLTRRSSVAEKHTPVRPTRLRWPSAPADSSIPRSPVRTPPARPGPVNPCAALHVSRAHPAYSW